MGIGTEKSGDTAVPIPAPGIGTRISAALDALGTRKNAALALGVSVDSLARYIREENTPPFDVAARLCAAAGRNLEWLATGSEPAKPAEAGGSGLSQALTLDNVKLAVQLLREALDDAEADLTPAKHGEAVVLLVQLLENGLPPSDVRPLARQTVSVITGDRVDAGPGKAAVGK